MDIFEQALEKAKKAEEKKQSKGSSGNFEFEEVQSMGLVSGEERAFRILGKFSNPFRNIPVGTDPTDPKFIYHSRILRDDEEGYAHINWALKEGDTELELDDKWILKRLYDKVYESKWKDFTDEEKIANNDNKKGRYEKLHKDTSIFKKLESNRKKDSVDKWPPKVYPQQRILLNVLDRHDTWCADNNHSKVLHAKNGWLGKDGTFVNNVTDPGIPLQAFNGIWENVAKFTKIHWDLDIVIKRNKEATNAYVVKDATETKFESDLIKKIVSTEPLSEKEKAYVLYDLDKLYKVSSYSKIKKNLTALFKLCDAELGTKFYDELEKLADEEAAAFAAKNAAEAPKQENQNQVSPASKEANKAIEKDDAKEEKKVERAARTEAKVETNTNDSMLKAFPKFNELSIEDKKDFIDAFGSIDATGSAVWNQGVTIVPCDNADCRTPLPNTVLQCPKCGTKLG